MAQQHTNIDAVNAVQGASSIVLAPDALFKAQRSVVEDIYVQATPLGVGSVELVAPQRGMV